MSKTLMFWLSILLIVLLVMTTMFCGCDESVYNTYSLKHEGIGFSFEYPSRYRVLYDNISSDHIEAILEIQRPVSRKLGYPLIHMDISENSGGINDARAKAELRLATLRKLNNFVLVDDSEIVIAGIKTENFKYSFSDSGDLNLGNFIIFYHNGLMWDISLLNHEENQEQEYQDLLNHMIETFKFLD